MLVLSRKKNESVIIGDDIEIIISEIVDDKVKLAIKAPKSMKVFRKELLLEIEEENRKSAGAGSIDIQELSSVIKKNI